MHRSENLWLKWLRLSGFYSSLFNYVTVIEKLATLNIDFVKFHYIESVNLNVSCLISSKWNSLRKALWLKSWRKTLGVVILRCAIYYAMFYSLCYMCHCDFCLKMSHWKNRLIGWCPQHLELRAISGNSWLSWCTIGWTEICTAKSIVFAGNLKKIELKNKFEWQRI